MKFIKDKYIELTILEKQKYIKLIKDKFERKLSKELELTRVSAPLLVTADSGLQDDLSGVERKVSFDILKDGKELEIVQSLAKWKRMALKKYDFPVHKGLYTDMTAIRRDDKMDETHSIYVDQWDWEKVIVRKDRTLDYLKKTVRKIAKAIVETSDYIKFKGFDGVELSKDVYFITSQQLADMYPGKTDKEKEYLITKEHKTVFIMQIGDDLSDGKPHDMRAPDYDDWSLDGDLLFYHEVLDIAMELTSMGIRVDKDALMYQIEKSGKQERLQLPYHKSILAEELPLSIGGGIGQSRLCMLLLGRAHIGEVQASYWDTKTLEQCKELEIELL
jgi:aspartate--ammonia ligase